MAAVKLSEREKNLLILTLGFAVFYVFYQFLLTPEWDVITRLRETARTKRLELKIAEGKVKIMQAIEKQVGIVPEKYAMPREEKALEVLNMISRATDKSGLKLIFVKPLLEEGGEGLRFSLSCSGSYKQLYDFLFILYRLNILVLIDGLDVKTNGLQNEPVLDIKIGLTAYY
jgi:Tfp pilus assembly protein PilO